MNIHIKEVDTEKYLEWLFSQKGTNKENEIKQWQSECSRILERIENDPLLSSTEKENKKKETTDSHNKIIDCVKKTIYWTPPSDKEKKLIQWDTNWVIESRKKHLEFDLSRTPLSRKTILTNHIEYIFEKELPSYSNIHKEVIAGCVVHDYFELGHYIGLIRFAQYLNEELENEENTEIKQDTKPLKWLGKPSHLGLIMNLLAELDYIDAPKKNNGEINYTRYAQELSKVFDFEGNNTETLSKMLSPETNSMEKQNSSQFHIPHRKNI